jgi:lipopolysaccharide biosynthesis glycosyltransferase
LTSPTLSVALAADAAFCRQLAVTLHGIATHSGTTPVDVYVLHEGYDAPLQQRVCAPLPDTMTLHWIEATSSRYQGVLLPDYLPTATLFRLRMMDLVPPEVERLIFLDTDVVVRASLAPLGDVDLRAAPLAAVRDAVHPWAASPGCLDWRSLGVPPDMPYFNAGVMVISTEAWRELEMGERALDLLRTRAFNFGDQCALNVVAGGGWTQLEPRWNVQGGHHRTDSYAWVTEPTGALDDALASPSVLHFTAFDGHAKPWCSFSTYPGAALWFDELDQTSWAGWRPDESAASRMRNLGARVSNRVRTAWRALTGRA